MLFTLGFWLIFAVVGVAFWVYENRRREERNRIWRSWSAARNWLFHREWPEIVNRFQGGPFGRGSSRHAEHGWEGQFNGLPVIGFRYQWTMGSGKRRRTYRRYVIGVRIDNAQFPRFQIAPRGVFGRGVTFENAVFNELWDVDTAVPRFAHDFMTPRSMELFLGPHLPFHMLWLDRDHLLMEIDVEMGPAAVDVHLQFACDLLVLLPDFVFREVGARVPRITRDGPGVSLEEQRRRMAAMEYQHRISQRR